MAKKEYVDLVKKVKDAVTKAAKEALTHYQKLLDALETAKKTNIAWRRSGGSYNVVDESDFLTALRQGERPLANLTTAYAPLNMKISELMKNCADVEDLLYLAEEFESLVLIVEKYRFKNAEYSICFTSWERYLRDKTKELKNKLHSDKKIHKDILLNTITVEGKKLEKARGVLERNQKELENSYADIEDLILHYSEKVADLVGQATQEWNALLGKLEKIQEELAAITLEQLDAAEAVATATLFEKSKMRKQQEEIGQKRDAKKAELDTLERKVGELVEKVLAVKLKGLDEHLDKLLDRVQELKNIIAGNQNEVQSHIDIIERAKGELNGK